MNAGQIDRPFTHRWRLTMVAVLFVQMALLAFWWWSDSTQVPLYTVALLAAVNALLLGAFIYQVGKLERPVPVRNRGQASIQQLLAVKDLAITSVKFKDDFLIHLSRELRTPLNAVLGFGQLLSREQEALTPLQREYINDILDAGSTMHQMINQLRELVQVENGYFDMQPQALPFERVTLRCLQQVAPLAKQHQVLLLNDTDAMRGVQLWADGERLQQVLVRLLSGAITYNGAQGEVVLRATLEGKGMACFEIEDRSRSIPAELLRQVFEPFAGPGNMVIEGTGLELALSRLWVQAMGGRLELEPRNGKGYRFRLLLPLAEQVAAQQKAMVGA